MEKVEYIGRYKIVHNIPDYSKEEQEAKKKEILKNLYNYFTYNKNHSTQK